MSQNIQKVVLHNILPKIRAEILHVFVFMVVLAAIFNLTLIRPRGHQRSRSFYLQWFLKTHYPQLTPCQISKTCHHVHDCDEFPPRYNYYFHNYSNNTAQLHNCTTNFLYVTMATDVPGEYYC